MGEKLGFYLGENWEKKSFGDSALCTGRDLLGLVGLVCKKKVELWDLTAFVIPNMRGRSLRFTGESMNKTRKKVYMSLKNLFKNI